MTRYRLTMVLPPVGYESFSTVALALQQAHEYTAGDKLRRQKRKPRPGWRLVDESGQLRGFLVPIDGAGKPPELGRPRDAVFRLRCLPEELDGWQQAAQARGESLSEGVRAALGERYGDE